MADFAPRFQQKKMYLPQNFLMTNIRFGFSNHKNVKVPNIKTAPILYIICLF